MFGLRIFLSVVVVGLAVSYFCSVEAGPLENTTEKLETTNSTGSGAIQAIKNGFTVFKEKVKEAYNAAKGKVTVFKDKVKSYVSGKTAGSKSSNETLSSNSTGGHADVETFSTSTSTYQPNEPKGFTDYSYDDSFEAFKHGLTNDEANVINQYESKIKNEKKGSA